MHFQLVKKKLLNLSATSTIDGIELMEILIDNGADVNMMNFRKKTPLHIACMNQSAEQAMTLLDKKAQRRPSAFDLLKGMPRDIVFNRIEAEDKAAADAIAAAAGAIVLIIYKSISPKILGQIQANTPKIIHLRNLKF